MSERANYECGCGQDIENNSPYPFFTAGNCSLAVVRAIFQRKIYANSLTVSAIGQALPSSVQTSFMKVPKQKLPAISLQCRSNQLKIHFRFDHSSSIFCLLAHWYPVPNNFSHFTHNDILLCLYLLFVVMFLRDMKW